MRGASFCLLRDILVEAALRLLYTNTTTRYSEGYD